jgi:predicted component of type VI protein secretion system
MYRIILVTNEGNPLTASAIEEAKAAGIPHRDWTQLPESVLPHLKALPATIAMKFPEKRIDCVSYGVPSLSALTALKKLTEEYENLNKTEGK